MITDAEALDQLCERMRGHAVVAVDTEADSLHSYFEKLCLVQVGYGDQNELVDPLAAFVLQPLLDLLAERRTVIHGLDFDVRMLRRAGRFEPREIFDTLIAARLTGELEFSLAALVERHFGVKLAKAAQKADWSRRPLSERMIEYACNDTRYLIPLSEKLEAALRGRGRWDWFTESCERALAQAQVQRERDAEDLWRIKGSALLQPREAAVLRELWHWRDGEAREMDRPAFKILRNEDLLHAAREFAAGRKPAFRALRGSRAGRFRDAVERALALPEEQWPRRKVSPRPKRDPDFERRLADLLRRRDKAAQAEQLDPGFLSPRAALEAVAGNRAQPADVLMRWQRALLRIEGD